MTSLGLHQKLSVTDFIGEVAAMHCARIVPLCFLNGLSMLGGKFWRLD
jgi:hypothetical protein